MKQIRYNKLEGGIGHWNPEHQDKQNQNGELFNVGVQNNSSGLGEKNEPSDHLTELLNSDDVSLVKPGSEEVEGRKNPELSDKGKSTKIKKKEKKKKKLFIPESWVPPSKDECNFALMRFA